MSGVESYEVTVDYRTLEDMYSAQNKRCERVLGICGSLLFGAITFVLVYGATVSGTFDYTLAVVPGVLLVLCLWLATGRAVTLRWNRSIVDEWFFRRTGIDPQTMPLQTLSASYEVRICDFGYEEVPRAGAGSRMMWCSLDPEPVEIPEGVCFTRADVRRDRGSELGIRFAPRGRHLINRVQGLLLVPRQVVDANPGLVDEISARVRASVGPDGPTRWDEARAWLCGQQPSEGDVGQDGSR